MQGPPGLRSYQAADRLREHPSTDRLFQVLGDLVGAAPDLPPAPPVDLPDPADGLPSTIRGRA